MTTDWKALCAELLAWAEKTSSNYYKQADVLLRARAALDEQEVWEGPPAVTTGAWLHPAYEPGDGSADGAQMVELAWWHPQFGCDSLQMVVDNARAILARRDNHPAKPDGSPADGEVGELVKKLHRDILDTTSQRWWDLMAFSSTAQRDHLNDITRAADLLQRQYPQPVPVSERLPGPEDCDVEGRCWFGRSESEDWSADWTLAIPEAVAEFCEFSPRTVWLPFHALPLPKLEGAND